MGRNAWQRQSDRMFALQEGSRIRLWPRDAEALTLTHSNEGYVTQVTQCGFTYEILEGVGSQSDFDDLKSRVCNNPRGAEVRVRRSEATPQREETQMILTWDSVLQRDDIIGGDLESQEDGAYYRGPIESAKKEGDSIVFVSSWIARMELKDGVWRKWHINTLNVSASMSPPADIGQGRIHFSMPLVGSATIFPKGGSKLDLKRVEGL